MITEVDVASLVAAARAGDDRAVSALYARYAPCERVWRSRFGSSMNDDDWNDLWQEMWIKVLRTLPQIDESICDAGKFSGYLKTACRSVAIDARRRREARIKTLHIGILQSNCDGDPWEFADDLPASVDAPEDEVVSNAAVSGIMEVLGRALPKARRARPIGYEVWKRARAGAIGVTAAARLMGMTREAAKHQDEQFRLVLAQEMRIEEAMG